MCVAAVGLIGAGVSAISGIMDANRRAGEFTQKAAEYRMNAMLKQRQAVIEQQAGQFKQRRMFEKAEQLTGQQVANFAAAGVTMDGSALDTVLDSRREALLDIGAIKFETDLRDNNLMSESRMAGYNAGLAQQAANDTRRAAPLAAIAPMVSGLTSSFSNFTRLGESF